MYAAAYICVYYIRHMHAEHSCSCFPPSVVQAKVSMGDRMRFSGVKVGYVHHTISKSKSRCRQFPPSVRGPVTPNADLVQRFKRVPGLELHCDMLANLFQSWECLGRMIDANYSEVLKNNVPQKRIEHAEDLYDYKRLGPGHLNSIDILRRRAKKEVTRQLAIRDLLEQKHIAEYIERCKQHAKDSRSMFRLVN